MEEEREPFDVGRKACLDGVFDNADPYPLGSPEAKEWSEGWFAALTELGAGAKVGIDARGLQVHLLDKFPLWRHLRATGNSASVNMTILIPLIGYLIVFNSHVVDVISLSRHLLGFEQQQGPSTRLLSLYFGLCLVAAASIIYNWMCPRVIKKYESAPEYLWQPNWRTALASTSTE